MLGRHPHADRGLPAPRVEVCGRLRAEQLVFLLENAADPLMSVNFGDLGARSIELQKVLVRLMCKEAANRKDAELVDVWKARVLQVFELVTGREKTLRITIWKNMCEVKENIGGVIRKRLRRGKWDATELCNLVSTLTKAAEEEYEVLKAKVQKHQPATLSAIEDGDVRRHNEERINISSITILATIKISFRRDCA